MVTENEVIINQSWDDEALEEKPKTDSKYFSDAVPEHLNVITSLEIVDINK